MDAGDPSAGSDNTVFQSSQAVPHGEDPANLLERCFAGRQERPVNSSLRCAAVGFSRYRGDWIGVLITPWFMDLFLLPGGGELWGDIPGGQHRYVELPTGTVPFTAADDPQFGPYQHSPLVAPVSALSDMATALQLAASVMSGILGQAVPLPAEEERGMVREVAAPPQAASRRSFFRRLAGKR